VAQKTAITTTTTTSATTSGLNAAVVSESADCATLNDSDVGRALDAALQNGIDGLLSTIGDDHMVACTTSSAAVGSTDCLLSASAASTETDPQHYLFYSSAHTDELIDRFLRCADAAGGDDVAATTAESAGELQAVAMSAEDWPVVDSLSNVQMAGGMLAVEFDASLLTIIELGENGDQAAAPVDIDGEACLTVTPGGAVSQVVNGETTAWNVFQGLEVSQFQVIGSEELTDGAPAEGSPMSEHDDAVVEDLPEENTLTAEGSDGAGSDATAQSAGPPPSDDAGCPDDLPVAAAAAAAKSGEQSSNPGTDSSDDEFVLIVDCVDGSDPDELDYQIVDEAAKTSDSSVTIAPKTADPSEDVGTGDDACNDAETNS